MRIYMLQHVLATARSLDSQTMTQYALKSMAVECICVRTKLKCYLAGGINQYYSSNSAVASLMGKSLILWGLMDIMIAF